MYVRAQSRVWTSTCIYLIFWLLYFHAVRRLLCHAHAHALFVPPYAKNKHPEARLSEPIVVVIGVYYFSQTARSRS
ncbi:hypothetical protein DFP73DRAFT_550217 [Morchella snyderi]|nr:hypothetical protein DFP73DRAFT_550217 [Morchella snyderi]